MAEHDALTPWSEVDESDPDGFRSYLDTVSGVERIEAVKRQSYRLLDPPADGRVLDAGCGTGDDARTLAEQIDPAGTVVGIDASRAMVETARERTREAGERGIDEAADTVFSVGDATGLPFRDDAFDGARSDRVLQHLPAPQEAFSELVRVSRPGGRVVVTDSDWGTLTLAAGEADIDDRLVSAEWSCARRGEVGRRLRSFADDAGLRDVTVAPTTLTFTDFETADGVLGFTGRIERLQADGEVSEATAASWRSTLQDPDGSFFSSLTLFTVAGTVPAEN
ncbi:MAG: methyltransferase domain-containing protein [Halolamina sp.]